MKPSQTRYNKLSDKQLRILKITYKFRYITAPTLASYLGLSSRQAVYSGLERLRKQEYLLERKNDNTNFSNKGTRYALAGKSFKLLAMLPNTNPNVLHARYKDKYSSEEFITHAIYVFRAYQLIKSTYPSTYTMYTEYEVYGQPYFPERLPHLYLHQTELGQDIFLDILDYEQFFKTKERLTKYLESYETGDWENETGRPFPVLLFVCTDTRIEKRFQKYVNNLLDGNGIDEIRIYTTTLKALLRLDKQNSEIWTNVLELEKIIGLDNL